MGAALEPHKGGALDRPCTESSCVTHPKEGHLCLINWYYADNKNPYRKGTAPRLKGTSQHGGNHVISAPEALISQHWSKVELCNYFSTNSKLTKIQSFRRANSIGNGGTSPISFSQREKGKYKNISFELKAFLTSKGQNFLFQNGIFV